MILVLVLGDKIHHNIIVTMIEKDFIESQNTRTKLRALYTFKKEVISTTHTMISLQHIQ